MFLCAFKHYNILNKTNSATLTDFNFFLFKGWCYGDTTVLYLGHPCLFLNFRQRKLYLYVLVYTSIKKNFFIKKIYEIF